MDTCVFCRIINKEIPSYVIYEDDNVLAMLAKDMEVYGHTLIIPKQHYQDIYDIPEDILAKLSIVAKKLANRYKDKIWATWINLLHASWKDAQQSVFHFHIHLFPRFENDGLDTRPKLPKIEVDKDEFLKKIKI
ncbi:MAG: Histidine triad (HIT) protein [uncultured bacterium (gcode 4)]|uniref:Histidine triad (HIT) protein n=1 Tax=uncultured bacterium (gcode 4) TaxID=1234023 RepID=K1X3V7_9BACT|nr:MAG: Histidine triad (HIT) protein [uncultured bacterium (gcode 4)]